MPSLKTVAQRLDRVIEKVTRQYSWSSETPAYGSRLLGGASERLEHRRIRIQVMMTVAILVAQLVGMIIATLLLTIAFPKPSVIFDAPHWLSFGLVPAYNLLAVVLGASWLTRQTTRALRWAIEARTPTRAEARDAFRIPARVALVVLFVWGFGMALWSTLYGLANPLFVPRFLFSMSVVGVLVATSSYLLSEFALRPVAARALEVGPTPRSLVPGIMGRTMVVWLLCSGLPNTGIAVTALFENSFSDLENDQYIISVLILWVPVLVFGFVLMWMLAWMTATPVDVVRAALKRVEQGDLTDDLVVFDGSELGELQRGFNSMVHGLRERERVRDLFGRHVGREVALAAERQPPQLGGEERHVAVVFIDIVGSTMLVSTQPPADVVQLLNRFFAVVIKEVDRHHGLVNKFQGDASLAIFGAPNHLEQPEDQALAAARAIAERLAHEVPECPAGIGVASGQVVAGNVGANERFEYTVIGPPVNEAARLCELAKSHPGRLLATADTLRGATERESPLWHLGEVVTLRGLGQPTRLASPTQTGDNAHPQNASSAGATMTANG
ncbi:adenylate/guanylate cyclase domain-containing protein [Mycobacterium attenuatum]|uniref:adenylate/guanylate cyclase domain-containing protein n=1 Tax=Mycobacterium attenuatum TaxID=2341086 RepID=UPI000F0405E6|nr:adenylate/guanylate cyclase domain-containing protein [Mycobacterium attenuatum]VBA60455.1 Adenylate cyclase 2 [Mycobacterium attenuatum]